MIELRVNIYMKYDELCENIKMDDFLKIDELC